LNVKGLNALLSLEININYLLLCVAVTMVLRSTEHRIVRGISDNTSSLLIWSSWVTRKVLCL